MPILGVVFIVDDESVDPGDKGFSDEADPSVGMLSFMAVVDGTVESGTNDDAEERSDRVLLV